MVALSSTVKARAKSYTGEHPQLKVFPIQEGATMFNMALTAILDGSGVGGDATRLRGRIRPWTGAADEIFLGEYVGEEKTGVAGSASQELVEGQVHCDGSVIDEVEVAGSGSLAAGAPVYSETDNPDDITATPPAAQNPPKQVGYLYRKRLPFDNNSLKWALLLLGKMTNDQLFHNRDGEGPFAAIAATVVVTQGEVANADKKTHVITAAAPAAITIPDPLAVELGNTAIFARTGGAGLPTLAYNDEAGNPVSHALNDGQYVKLKAVSLSGWQRV